MWLRSVLSHRQLSAVLLDLENLVLGKNTISFEGCVAQLYTLTFSELMLLTVMAYDRYLAICQPLCYEQGDLRVATLFQELSLRCALPELQGSLLCSLEVSGGKCFKCHVGWVLV